jgi:SSS family transporter
MKSLPLIRILAAFTIAFAFTAGASAQQDNPLVWSKLPALPDSSGFAGMFAGVSNGALIAAGGANFPDGLPWEGGQKAWYDNIYVLQTPAGDWKLADQRLPDPLAYGVSVSYGDGVVIIGGSDGTVNSRLVYRLFWDGGAVVIEDMPSLPIPLADMGGALVGDVVFVGGGMESPTAPSASNAFFALDLSEGPAGQWKQLPSWPGPARMQPVAGSMHGAFYLMSGRAIEPATDEKGNVSGVQVLPLLTDAYRFIPGDLITEGHWETLPEMPRAAVAAPSPAPVVGQAHLLLLGGITTEMAAHTDMPTYPEFNTRVLGYHSGRDEWVELGQMPEGASRVTAPTVRWNGDWIIPNGEKSPGVRSPDVYRLGTKVRFGVMNWAVLIVYLLLLIGMGFYLSKKEHGTEDFFLAGRRIPWWAAGLSVFGTQLSAITFMALPALVFDTNWAFAVGSATAFLAAPIVAYGYIPFFRRLHVTTAYEYLEKRFGLPMRLLGGLSFMLFQLGRMGVVLFLPAVALSAVTGIDIYLCIGVMGVVCTLYTVMGGIEAVIWTVVLQVIILMGGGLLCLVFAGHGVEGGLPGIVSQGMAEGKMDLYNPGFGADEFTLWVAVVGLFFLTMIPLTSDQSVVQRYLTTVDEKAAQKSIWTHAWLTLPTIFIFYGIGTALYVFYNNNPQAIASDDVNEILPWFIVQELPLGIAGLVIAAIFAATMSSLDSGMNSVATVWVNDIHRRFRPGFSDTYFLRLARWVTVIVGVFATGSAMLIGSLDIKYIFDVFQEVLGLIGGSLAGVFVLAIFTRRATGVGAVAGLFVGAAVPWLIKTTGVIAVHPYLYGGIGVVSCVATGLVFSLFGGKERPLDGLTLWTRTAQASAQNGTGERR